MISSRYNVFSEIVLRFDFRRYRGGILLILALLLVTGCSNPALVDTGEISQSQNRVEHVGTDGQLILIDSDNVRAAGYDDASKTMTVQFDSGWTYEYYGVSPELWLAFLAAQPNPWSQVGFPMLVEAGVPYRRIS